MDLARLGFEFDGKGAAAAEQAYDRLEAGARGVEGATKSAERATERLQRAARGLDPALNDTVVAMRQQSQVLGAVKAATGLTANETLNLSRQFADVGVSVASGMPIWMVAIQQGAQIGDTFQVAATRGVGFRAALDSLYVRLLPILAPLVAVGAAAAAFGSVFALAARDINKGSAEVMRDLNLTDEQMKTLKASGESMGVTMGDVFRGIGTTIKEVLQEAFGPQIAQAKSAWTGFLDDLGTNTMNEIRTIVGAFTGAYGAVTETWSMLPAAMGDAAYTAANATVGALNWMLRKSVDGINFLRNEYNKLPAWMRGNETAPTIDGAFQIGMADNPYPGGMDALITKGGAAYARNRDAGVAWVNDTANSVRSNTLDSFSNRVSGAAGDAGAGADANGAERTARAAREAREEIQKFARVDLGPLQGMFQEIITPLEQAADEMRVIDHLARDMGRGLASAFGQSGQAMGEMLSTLTSYRAQLASWAEEEASGQADFLRLAEINAQRGHAQVGVYGDMAAAARGFFEEGSDGYKVLLAVEQAYRLQQMLGMIQSMAMGGQETAFTVAQNAVRATSHGVVAVARAIASLPFPLNIAAGAATIAALAAIGVKLMGGGGGKGGRDEGMAANDNVASATQSIRQQGAREQQSRDTFTSGIAQRVQVHVTADRKGLNAYVADVARNEAAPIAVNAARAGAAYAKADTMATLQRRETFTLRKANR